jgi:hypothetical protein
MAICADSPFQLNQRMLFPGRVYASTEDLLASFVTKANAY